MNPIRGRIRDSARKLNFAVMDIESRLIKIGITIKWVTYYLWAPVFAVLIFLWRLTAALVAIAFKLVKYFVVGLVQEGIPKLFEKLKRKRGAGTHDPESQELNGGGDLNGNEKAVNEEIKKKAPQ